MAMDRRGIDPNDAILAATALRWPDPHAEQKALPDEGRGGDQGVVLYFHPAEFTPINLVHDPSS